MKVAFLGNSEFSQIVLEKLLTSKHLVVCVVSNVDKQTGRGRKILTSPFKQFVKSKNLPLLEFKSVSKEGEEAIRHFHPDVLVTASFGQILKDNILNLAPYGVVNVHASLLPKYRGSAPINYAIINGEATTGITIMKTELSLDTGDIMLQKSLDILDDETAGELTIRLAHLGGEALLEALDKMEEDSILFTPQDDNLATMYRRLDKDMSYINFNKSMLEIKNFCRGLNPWPISRVNYKGADFLVYKVDCVNSFECDINYKAGDIASCSSKSGLIVKCRDGFVRLSKIQAPGGKILDDTAFLNGKKLELGVNLMQGEEINAR